jgi:hypothetical protein
MPRSKNIYIQRTGAFTCTKRKKKKRNEVTVNPGRGSPSVGQSAALHRHLWFATDARGFICTSIC